MPIKIGVLLPNSRMFPGVDRGYLAGLEGSLAGSDPPIRVVVEPTGTGSVRDVVMDKAQRLLLVERPQVVVGILGTSVERHVRGVFSDHATPFVVCNLGGDLLLTGSEPSPFVYWNSLNVWRSTYALGFWASQVLGGTAAIAAGFHEAGYGLVHAFWLGYETAGGGHILTTEVTHKESATADPSEAIRRIAELGPDFVIGLYSGREGVSFMRGYDEAGLAGTIPLISTPLMTHGHWLPQMGEEVIGVRTACSWVPGTYPEDEGRFRDLCASAERPSPDVFGLLGYEAGLIVRAAVARVGGTAIDGRAMCDAMSGVDFSSPRGAMRVDPKTREVVTSDRLVTIEAEAGGAARWVSNGPLGLPARYATDANEVRAQEAKSGWVNPYLVN